MNILQLSLLLAIPLKCVIASETVCGKDVIEALSETRRKDLKASRRTGRSGKIAMIYLMMWLRRMSSSSLDSSIKLGMQRQHTLAALFLKRPDKVDEVLKKIKCIDDDLVF